MSDPTIPLVRDPTREDYMAVIDAADLPCECPPEMAAMLKEAEAARQLMCKPCAARQVINGIVTLSETL